jgi:WD40 repeat protein
MRWRGIVVVLLACCGHKSDPVDAAPAPTAECVKARETRQHAAVLDRDGHEERALAALVAANAACEAERATSWDIELHALAESGKCTEARALAPKIPVTDAGVAAALTTCDVIEAPAKGTEKSLRAKMRDAWNAEQAKDFARARTLYLEAWTEQHESRALEGAARAAAYAGDAAGARRLRDRALTLAEATSHAHAAVRAKAAGGGSARLIGNTLVVARGGEVDMVEVDSGDVRVAVQSTDVDAKLSPLGTLAYAHHKEGDLTMNVWDVLSGTLALKLEGASHLAFSPDDTRIAAMSDKGHVRVIDVGTGDVIGTFDWGTTSETRIFVVFAPDRDHVAVIGNDRTEDVIRTWDVTTKSRTGPDVAMKQLVETAFTSQNGHWLCTQSGDAFRVRDMVAGKDVADVKADQQLHNVYPCTVSNDGKAMVTRGRLSIRLWDVAQQKQTFVEEAGSFGGYDYQDTAYFGFTDDSRAVLYASPWAAPVWSWDVATGKKTAMPTDPKRWVHAAAWAPGIAAFGTEDGVRVVREHGDVVVTCRSEEKYQAPEVIELSHDGKSIACEMRDGTLRIYDTTTWAERGRAPVAAQYDHVALRFSNDDKTLTVLTNTDRHTFDVRAATSAAKVKLKHPTRVLVADDPMQPHARRIPAIFDDGTFSVRPWGGDAALFDAAGAWVRDLAVPTALAPGVFSADGSTFAAMTDTALVVIDVATGAKRSVPIAGHAAGTIGMSRDGKTLVVGQVVVTGADTHEYDGGILVANLLLDPHDVVIERASLFLGASLDIIGDAALATLPTGELEVRGKMSGGVCVAGAINLERATCDDRARDDVIAKWLERTRPAAASDAGAK